MAEVCARPHLVALYDYACPNNGGLTSIAQEATGSLRVDIGGAILRRRTRRETGADSVESYGVRIGDGAPLGL
jgi:hypothetical protein